MLWNVQKQDVGSLLRRAIFSPGSTDQLVVHPCLTLGKQAYADGVAMSAERVLTLILCFLTHPSRSRYTLKTHRTSDCQSICDSEMIGPGSSPCRCIIMRLLETASLRRAEPLVSRHSCSGSRLVSCSRGACSCWQGSAVSINSRLSWLIAAAFQDDAPLSGPPLHCRWWLSCNMQAIDAPQQQKQQNAATRSLGLTLKCLER